MTKSKRIASTAAAVLMAVSMVAASSAMSVSATSISSGYTLTIKDARTGHEYSAYQIFAGKPASDKSALTNVVWGNGVNGEDLKNALIADAEMSKIFGKCADVQDVYDALAANPKVVDTFAKFVSEHLDENNVIDSATASNGYTFDDLSGGYYFVKDKTVPATDAYSSYMLRVVKDTAVSVKADQPKVEKKVYEEDYSNTDGGYGNGYNDVADHFIGEEVAFKLIGTLPAASEFAAYDTYYYEFNDTLSAGFKAPEKNAFTVSIDNVDVTDGFDIEVYDVMGQDGSSIGTNITIKAKDNDIKAVMDAHSIDYSKTTPKITVDYKAVLDDDAVIGLNGNENKVDLKFSNNPNAKGDGDNNTGKTPEDKVIVFTYEFDTLKIDSADAAKKLQGAEFTLQNSENKYASVVDGVFKGWLDTADDTCTLVTDENGLIKVKGLESGTYTVTETKAPTDYNLPSDPFEVTLSASKYLGQEWTGVADDAFYGMTASIKDGLGTSADYTNNASVDVDGAKATLTVKNTKGAELPETGGIGTKLFYIGGGALVLASAVILVTKKRAKDAE